MTAGLSLSPRTRLLVLLGYCAAASVLFGLYFNGIGPDDPWITFRYSENIAAGHGFVFNPGERVYGTSTPLYALLHAGARLLGLPIPQTSWVIGFASMNASIVMLFLLARRIHSEFAGLVAAGLLASAYLFHRVATFGMETPLYTALIIGTFLAYSHSRVKLAAALAAACLLTRLDGAAVGAALALSHVLVFRRVPWTAGLVYALVAAPWLIFAIEYFGSAIPNTMVAKQIHTEHTRLYWMPLWLATEPRAWFACVGLAAAAVVPASRSKGLALGLWAIMYAAAYSVIAMHRYDWYLTPLLPALAAFAGIAVIEVGERFVREPQRRFAVVTALALALTPVDAAHAVWRLMGNEGILAIERTRHEAAVWMRDNLPAGAPIATGGIGLVGYITNRPIRDAMGLVTPGSMRIEYEIEDPARVPFPRFLPAVIEDYEPEYVFDGFGLAPGEDMPPFMKNSYEVVKDWSTHPYSMRFILYRRVHQDEHGR